jgi:single-stranded-DNA-specific exonuclease
MAPIFISKSVVEEGNGKIVGDKHIKMRLLYRNRSSQPVDAIAFNQKQHFDYISTHRDFDILYHVEENTWNNVTNIQLNIKDIRINM